MMAYHEILSAIHGGHVQNSHAVLWSRKLSGIPEQEISGTLPLTFRGFGKNFSNYRIYGNTVQNGTPIPETPVEVQGVGERTENLAPPYSDLVSGYVSSSGGISSASSPYNEKSSMFFSVSPNTTYTFSFRDGLFPTDGIESRWHAVGYYGADYQFIIRYKGAQGKPLTTETPPNAKYARISYRSYSSTGNTMFVEGSTSPDHYIPYGYKIPVTVSNGANSVTTPVYIGSEPLHKIGDYADYVDFNRGMAVRKIKKLVLTGEENWSLATNGRIYRINLNDYLKELGTVITLSSHYSGGMVVDNVSLATVSDLTCTCIASDSGSNYFYVRDDSLMSTGTSSERIAAFKSFLSAQYSAGTPVIVWYILAEPEEEPLEQLIPVHTLSGTNILAADTTVQPSEIYIKGKIKSLATHTLIDSENQILISSDNHQLVTKEQ